MNELQRILETIGLTSVEASTYLSCLQLGTQNADMLSKHIGLSPRDTLSVLHDLHRRGFLSKFTSDKDFFTAEPASVVLRILENEHYDREQRLQEFRKSVDAFGKIANPTSAQPTIAFFGGKEGVIAAYEDTLTSKTDILAITSVDDIETEFSEYFPRYYKRRKSANILIKAIFPDTGMSRARQKKDVEELRISRLVPSSLLKDFHIEYYIYDNKVAFFSIVEAMAVIIESTFVANSMRTVFSMLWQMSEKQGSADQGNAEKS
jgi:sugar-specific transcriptional regulator TrmB